MVVPDADIVFVQLDADVLCARAQRQRRRGATKIAKPFRARKPATKSLAQPPLIGRAPSIVCWCSGMNRTFHASSKHAPSTLEKECLLVTKTPRAPLTRLPMKGFVHTHPGCRRKSRKRTRASCVARESPVVNVEQKVSGRQKYNMSVGAHNRDKVARTAWSARKLYTFWPKRDYRYHQELFI